MKTSTSLPAAALALALSSACGNFSQEDLLFLAAVPSKDAVALRPPGAEADPADDGFSGTTTQALDRCGRPGADELRCMARGWARGFNALTFALLSIVDGVVQHPPSRRAPGKRVWGPFFLDDQGNTARFEMVRGEDGATFSYCLHVKPGRAGPGGQDDDVDCSVGESEHGYLRFLTGTFRPGVEDDRLAGSGAGTMLLDAGRIPDDGDPFFDALSTVAFDYDNSDGTAIAITLTFLDEQVPPAEYGFARAQDGSGTFFFAIDVNIGETDTPAVEHVDVRAAWNADGAGRAEADVTQGDVPAGSNFHVTECWDAAFDVVFRETTFDDQREARGDEALCAIEDPLF